MKKALIVLAVVLVSCAQPGSRDPYHPTRPHDIPETTCDGTPIEWNWEKQRAYNAGQLYVERDSIKGCAICIVRKIK